MTTYLSRMLFGLVAIILFNLFNLLYFGYKLQEAAGYMLGVSLMDFIVYLVLFGALEAKRVFA